MQKTGGTVEQENKPVVVNDNLPFDIIQQSDILTADDLKALDPLRGELKETFVKAQVFRTRTEAECSVLNNIKHPTPASKYWQSVREQNVHFHELVMLSYEYRKAVVELKKLDRKTGSEKDDLELELLQIEKEKKTFELRCMERTAKDRIREITMWSEIKTREAESMTPAELEDVDNHQLKSYTLRFISEVKVMGTNGSPSERRNAIGLLFSSVALCEKRGLLPEIYATIGEGDRKNLIREYGAYKLKHNKGE